MAVTIEVDCPHCKHHFSVPIQRTAPGDSYTCPNCSEAIVASGDEQAAVQDVVSRLQRSLNMDH